MALRRHLRWYDAKARRDAAEIRRVTRGNTRPNVGTVLLRDAFLEWAGGSALAEAEAGGRVSDLNGDALDFSEGAKLDARVTGIVATNGRVHDIMLEALRDVGDFWD